MSQYGYLEHHGIKGQKWGTRNGPPYPLSYQAHNPRERKANPTGKLDNYGYGKKPDFNFAKTAAKGAANFTRYGVGGKTIERAAKKIGLRANQIVANKATGRYASVKGGKDSDWTRDKNEGDFTLKKGQSAYRLVTDKNEKIKDKKMMYATVNEDDRALFKGMFTNNVIKGPKQQYEKEMTFDKDIKVASKDTQIQAIMKATGLNQQEATTVLGRMNYELVKDELERSTDASAFLKEIKRQGYDAVLDLNDSGWFGKQPVVLIDPENYLSENTISKVSKRDKRRAIDDISSEYYSLGSLAKNTKELIGNKTKHYTRNQLNTDLPKNDKDAEKKGWRKLSSKESAMHQFSQNDNVENSKWVSPDGHKEVVFTGKGKNQRITKDVRDEGTYNYYDPQNNPVLHTVYDVIPYIILGNEVTDSTTAASRIGQSVKNFLKKYPEDVDISESAKTVDDILKKKKVG